MSTGALVRDRQQEKTLSMLEHAQGAEVTYDELREAGVQYPATTISELELSGVPVERGRWVQKVCWRLEPHREGAGGDPASPREPEGAPAAEGARTIDAASAGEAAAAKATPIAETKPAAAPAWEPIRFYRSRPPARLPRLPGLPALSPARALAALALLAAGVTVAILILTSLGGSPSHPAAAHHRQSASAKHSHPAAATRKRAAHHTSHPASSTAPTPRTSSTASTRPASTAASTQPTTTTATQSAPPTGSPTALEAQGHSLLDSGQYSSAIPVLKQAVQATGEHPGACTQPTTQGCLTYAYALYDLGRALQLSGNPAAAIPILKLRLAINDQRSVVGQELQLAEKAAQG